MSRRLLEATGLALVLSVAAARTHAAAPPTAASPPVASAPASRAVHHATLPAANFLVQWRIAPTPGAGIGVFTSRSASTGGSGFGPGAVVVGTSRPGLPAAAADDAEAGVRVANGAEASLRFDTARARTVVDLSWIGTVPGGAPSSATAGAATHEEVVHEVEGLRVRPRWTHGDTVALALWMSRSAAAAGQRDVELQTTVEASLGEWVSVAHLSPGEGDLQIRVSWH